MRYSLRRAIKGGRGILTKPFKDEDLLNAIQQALDVDSANATAIGRNRVAREQTEPDAARSQVLGLVTRLNKQIAAELGTKRYG